MFHSVAAIFDWIEDHKSLRLLTCVIITAWKAVQQSLSGTVQDIRIAAFNKLMATLPAHLPVFTDAAIQHMVAYFERHWFSGRWKQTWTKYNQIEAVIADKDSLNSQATVDNGTEALIKQVQEQVLDCKVNHHSSTFVLNSLTSFLLKLADSLVKVQQG